MKKLLSAILAAVLAVSLVGCGGGRDNNGGGQTDNPQEETKKVVNPVRSELYDDQGTKLADIEYEYDADGNRLSNTTYWVESWGGGWDRDEYTYNSNGDMLTKTASYSWSEGTSTMNYEYDADGKLLKTYLEGDASMYTGYTYDENGHAVKRAMYYSDGSENYPVELTCDREGRIIQEKEVWESNGWVFIYKTTYDENGNILKWEYSANGEVLLTHNYDYNDEGLLVRQDCSIESWKMEGYVLHYYE